MMEIGDLQQTNVRDGFMIEVVCLASGGKVSEMEDLRLRE